MVVALVPLEQAQAQAQAQALALVTQEVQVVLQGQEVVEVVEAHLRRGSQACLLPVEPTPRLPTHTLPAMGRPCNRYTCPFPQ